jgi:hypothetical protein
MELYNSSSEDVDLTGWTLSTEDGGLVIDIAAKAVVVPTLYAGGFFLLERTDDSTVPSVPADVVYTGALGNEGETLVLKNASGAVVDTIVS